MTAPYAPQPESTSIVPAGAQIELGAQALLNASRMPNAVGFAAQKELIKRKKDGFRLNLVMAVDGTASMEKQVAQINSGVSEWVGAFTDTQLGDATRTMYGNKFTLGGAIVVFGDISTDQEPFKLIPIIPGEFKKGNPFSQYLAAFRTMFDGGMVGAGESIIEAMFLALGLKPDGTGTMPHRAVDSLLTQLLINKKAFEAVGCEYGGGNGDIIAEYYKIMQLLPPHLVIAMTDDFAKAPRQFPVITDGQPIDLRASISGSTTVATQNGGIGEGSAISYSLRNEHVNGPPMSFENLSEALAAAGSPEVCILTPDISVPGYAMKKQGEAMQYASLQNYYKSAGIGTWMDINALNNSQSPLQLTVGKMLTNAAFSQMAKGLDMPQLKAPLT